MMRIFAWLLIALVCVAPKGAIADMACLSYPYSGEPAKELPELETLLAGLSAAISRFPSLQEGLETRRPRICLTGKLRDAHGYLDADENRIVLDNRLSGPMRRAVLIHELRHLDQLATGACPGESVSMQANARGVMAMEADASAVMLLVAWQLKEEGDASVWQAIGAWPNQADIAAEFSATMVETGQAARAAEAAFTQWFASDWRRKNYYVAACTDYLDAQDRSKTLPRYGALNDDFLGNLCLLPSGERYRCTLPELRR